MNVTGGQAIGERGSSVVATLFVALMILGVHAAELRASENDAGMPIAARGDDSSNRADQNRGPVLPPRDKTANQAKSTPLSQKPHRITGLRATTGRPWYRSAIGSLAVVLVVLGVAYWLVKKWVPAARRSDSGAVRVVAQATLSPKHSVALLRLGRRFVMVGLAPDGINLLSEIDDPEEVADLAVATEQSGHAKKPEFADMLGRESRGYRAPKHDDGKESVLRPLRRVRSRDQLSDLLHRLRNIQSGS